MILFDLLARSASRGPDRPALCFRGNTTTYRELAGAAKLLAGGLASLGIGEVARVAILLPNCPPFAITYLGAGLAGASVVPVNVLCRPDEVRHVLQDSASEVLVTAEPFRPLVQALRPHLPDLKHVVTATESGAEDGEIDFRALLGGCQAESARADGDDLAVLIYTSGTTGRPKGAMLTHRNLIANAESCEQVLELGPEDCFLSALPLFHSFAATVFLVLPILVGARIQLVERFLPSNTLGLMEQSGATIFGGVPSMFDLMLDALGGNEPSLSFLRLCISGGAPLPPEIWRSVEETFGTTVIEGYGLTEASPVVAVNPPHGVRKPGSVGPALPDVEVRIVDDEGNEVPQGEIGELIVYGENVMTGYLHNPEETASVLRDGWLYTGDLARMDEDGYLYIAGRKKELIIVGGLNVYPGEVERVLIEHPAVIEAAAFGIPDESRGEAVCAAVVLRPDTVESAREIQAFCREKLAPYKVPRRLDIREQLPKNALGKVTRHVLREEIVAE